MKMSDNCLEIDELFINFFDNVSSETHKNILCSHINKCPICKNNHDYQDIINALAKIKNLEPVTTSDNYLEKLKNKIELSDRKIISFRKYFSRTAAVAGFTLIILFSGKLMQEEIFIGTKASKMAVTRDLINMDIVPPAFETNDERGITLEMQGMEIGQESVPGMGDR